MSQLANRCGACGHRCPPFDDPCPNCGALPPGSCRCSECRGEQDPEEEPSQEYDDDMLYGDGT